MRIEVKMPSFGYDVEQAKLATWLKGVGDRVEQGEPLAEIETDRLTIEMESLATGVLDEIVCGAGEVAPVGAVIAYLEDES